uniref:2OGFe(II) oxygenase superfamily protein putative n=1 Tax=Albugo laibachii Nc14 TaxID=890382 RepID=F0WCA2_9STRA|nr:2OGFe(II) oxygenase superfamily protein putative [Albugo laibachii Nc14]|eukprot:CCA18816.1 2OGFe(II) oxygenase superfamily protein putative [Albugo laibachii Nc14]
MQCKDDQSIRENIASLDETVRIIANAAEECGFFYIENHGVAVELLQAFKDTMKEFFDLPKDVKNGIRRKENNPTGYFDAEITRNVIDWKEMFDYAQFLESQPSKSEHSNQWPAEEVLPNFRKRVIQTNLIMENIARRICMMLAVGLGQPLNFFDKFFGVQDPIDFCSGNSSTLRLNYYPVSSRENTTLGVHPHTDLGAVTILLQDDSISALQVYHPKTSSWLPVPPISNTFIVNLGDMMQVWSNDKYRAPVHRVLSAENSDRYSAPYFYHPFMHSTIEPITKNGEKPHYRPISWLDFLMERVKGNYADIGEEVQINRYRII